MHGIKRSPSSTPTAFSFLTRTVMSLRGLVPLLLVILCCAAIILHTSFSLVSPLIVLRRTILDPQSEPVLVRPQLPRPLFFPKTNFASTAKPNLKELSSVEQELERARAAIKRAAAIGNAQELSRQPNIYHNEAAFYQSYAEMEKRFKIFVYEEGEEPLVHDGPYKGIYATEGRFIGELESLPTGGSSLRTSDPNLAHAFFLPFSVVKLRKVTIHRKPMRKFVANYVAAIASKHPFWHRTSGADHFMLSCHDWAPDTSQASPELYKNGIRALCNANTSEGFIPNKDVSIPEIKLDGGEIPSKLLTTPPDSAPRRYLSFFAGALHGRIRPILLEHWKGKDKDMQVFENLPTGLELVYHDFMHQAKFCLCPSGYEVASPRVVEAIYAGCVPVLMSEGYVPPFSDVLRWEAFSLTVPVGEIPRLKEVLEAVPEEKLRRLREGGRAVRKHFEFNHPSKRFDAFHMILHSVWLRRINRRLID